jgi:hypothetical protein
MPVPNVQIRPRRFQEADPTAKPRGVVKPRPGATGQNKPRPGSSGDSRIDSSPGTSSGGNKPRPGASSSPQTFVPSDISDPTVTTQGQDQGFTLEQYQPGLSLTAKLAIGATVLVGLLGLAWTVRRRVRGDVRK